jgi:hypothetical protein
MINIVKLLEGIKIVVKKMMKGLDPLEWLLIDLIAPKSNFNKVEGMVTVRNSVDFTAPGGGDFYKFNDKFYVDGFSNGENPIARKCFAGSNNLITGCHPIALELQTIILIYLYLTFLLS